MAQFYQSSENDTYEKFHQYAQHLSWNQSVQAWEWIPAVPAADKERFEQAARAAGMESFQIWQRDGAGKRVPAAGREAYYPVFRVTPEEGNRAAIGFDLGSDPVRRAALEEALRNGFATASEPVTLVQETANQKGMLIFRPVFVGTERLEPLGLALTVLRLGDVLKTAIQDDVVEKELILARGDESFEILASSWTADTPPSGKLTLRRPVLAFGKTFIVAAHAGPKFLSEHPERAGLSVGLTGLLLTAALALVVSVLRRRRQILEGLVRERTTALRQSEEHLSATLRSIGGGVIVCDRQGKVVSLNSIAENLTGWSSAQAAGRPLEDIFRIINTQTREAAQNPVAQALQDGVNVALANHTALISRNGTEHQIADSCAPIRDVSEAVTGAVLVFRDVTEEYRRLKEMRESNERFDQLAEQSRTVIWQVDTTGLYTYVSGTAASVLGYKSEELVGKMHFYDLHSEAEREAFKALVLEGFARRKPFRNFENQAETKTGQYFWLSTNGMPVLDESGRRRTCSR